MASSFYPSPASYKMLIELEENSSMFYRIGNKKSKVSHFDIRLTLELHLFVQCYFNSTRAYHFDIKITNGPSLSLH
jgi:hypothetical protein